MEPMTTTGVVGSAPFRHGRSPGRGPRRAVWTDVRLFIGIALVVASVCGVWAVLTLGHRSTPMYVAAHTITRGQPITAADLAVVDAALGHAADAYVAADALPADAVATRTVTAGEFLARSAAQPRRVVSTTTVVVRSGVPVPRSLRAGAAVELWAAAQKERGVYDVPRILVADATVATVDRDEGVMSGSGSSVELVIPRADVAEALAAIAGGSSMSVVPATGRD